MRSFLCVFCLWLTLVACRAVELVGPIQVAPTESRAIVSWKTDVSTGTRVQVRPNHGSNIVPDNAPGTNHTVTLDGLQPGTTYTIDVGTARVWVGTTTFITPGTRLQAVPPAKDPGESTRKNPSPVGPGRTTAPPARQTWGNLASLQDHFERHGADFNARNPEEYARLAWEFLQRAKSTGLPAKLEDDGVLRVFDPKTQAFAAYNKNGTTKTFFKATSRDYFERQPGRVIDLKARR